MTCNSALTALNCFDFELPDPKDAQATAESRAVE
jgi:hypothetical protein